MLILSQKFVNFLFKLVFEIIVVFVGIFVLTTLIWWLLMFLSQVIGNCSISDNGFLKPAYIDCNDTFISKSILKPILRVYESVFGIPLYMILIFLILKLPIILTIVIIASIFLSIFLINKDADNQFPIMTRYIITTIKSLRM